MNGVNISDETKMLMVGFVYSLSSEEYDIVSNSNKIRELQRGYLCRTPEVIDVEDDPRMFDYVYDHNKEIDRQIAEVNQYKEELKVLLERIQIQYPNISHCVRKFLNLEREEFDWLFNRVDQITKYVKFLVGYTLEELQ